MTKREPATVDGCRHGARRSRDDRQPSPEAGRGPARARSGGTAARPPGGLEARALRRWTAQPCAVAVVPDIAISSRPGPCLRAF